MNQLLGPIASSKRIAATAIYDSIATVTVGSTATATISFSSIPDKYKHLEIRYVAKADTANVPAENIEIAVNGNATNSYGFYYWGAAGSGSASTSNDSTGSIRLVNSVAGGGGNAANFSSGYIRIYDYSSTNKYKTLAARTIYMHNDLYAYENVHTGYWQGSQNAINQVEFTITGGIDFKQNTQFALYGISG